MKNIRFLAIILIVPTLGIIISGTIIHSQWQDISWCEDLNQEIINEIKTSQVNYYSLEFDGIDDYVYVPDNDALDIAIDESKTIGLWFKSGSSSQNYPMLIIKGYDSNRDFYSIRYNNDNTLSFSLRDLEIDGSLIETTNSFYDGEWHHAVIVLDRAIGQFSAYVDGTIVDSNSVSNFGVIANSDQVDIGNIRYNNRKFNGYIDDVRIYNRALSSNEIQNLVNYNNPTTNGLVLHYDFEQINGNTCYDQSGNNNHGTIYGATQSSDNPFRKKVNVPYTNQSVEIDGIINISSEYQNAIQISFQDFENHDIDVYLEWNNLGLITGFNYYEDISEIGPTTMNQFFLLFDFNDDDVFDSEDRVIGINRAGICRIYDSYGYIDDANGTLIEHTTYWTGEIIVTENIFPTYGNGVSIGFAIRVSPDNGINSYWCCENGTISGSDDFEMVSDYGILEFSGIFIDNDSDGLADYDELNIYLTDPNDNDTDNDLLSDYNEIFIYSTNPNDNDTDSDLLSDYDEIFVYSTNPNNPDTDGDGVDDGAEVAAGTDPNSPPSSVEFGIEDLILPIIVIVVIILGCCSIFLYLYLTKDKRKRLKKEKIQKIQREMRERENFAKKQQELRERRVREERERMEKEKLERERINRENLEREKQQIITREKEILEKVRRIMQVSTRIELEMMRNALNLDKKTFDSKIFDWAHEFDFEIDGKYLNIKKESVSDFIDKLDRQFETWRNEEDEKSRKI